MNRWFFISGLMLFSALAWFAGAGDPATNKATEALSQDEQALKHAGIALDTPALLNYFRRRTPSAQEQAGLKHLAGQLGSSSYSVRARATEELIRAGRASLPWLRLTLKSADTETARRAQHCIRIIEQNTRLGHSATASRVLADRRAPGAVEALLAYLPLVDVDWVEEEIRQNLKRLAMEEGRAASILETALSDAEAKRRAAAAWIVGQSTLPRQRLLARPRLADDVVEVRFSAASALVSAKDPQAVPVLIACFGGRSPSSGMVAEDLLFRLAGDAGPSVWLDVASDNQGRKVRTAWETWWKAQEAKFNWENVRLEEHSLGLTLVAENQRADGAGRIYECTPTGDVRWQIRIQNPVDVQWLPGGRILVADSRASQIYEMDTRGVIGWKHTGLAPTSCQRLPSGNTVVSTYQCIYELTREGKTAFSFYTQGHTYHARKLPDGHFVWIDACGEITEIDERGKEVAKVKVGAGLSWGSIERLRNGRFLVALGGINKVQEIDLTGRVYWEKAVTNPNRTVRLANGNILVASHGDQCVYEFDTQGKECWKHECAGRPFAVQRR